MTKTTVFVLAITIAMSTSFVRLPADMQADKSSASFGLVDGEETMLCNVIVRAIHDLQIDQKKSLNDIMLDLGEDCKNLDGEELIEQCHQMVTEQSAKIYAHVTNGVEMSQICEKVEDDFEKDLLNDGTTECSNGSGNKCQCCKAHVEKRKLRLRYIVKQMTKQRLQICEQSPRPNRCREWIRREEQRALKRIHQICPYAVCEHLGFCGTSLKPTGESKLLMMSKNSPSDNSPSIWLKLLNQQLDEQVGTYFSKDVCGEMEPFQSLCIHLGASVDSLRYTTIYMAALHNNITWIDNDLRKQTQSARNDAAFDVCDDCKNIVQSSLNIYMQIMETMNQVVDRTCEQCPEKEKCIEFGKKQFQKINTYLASLNPGRFCSLVGMCSATTDGRCASCIQRLQINKDAAREAINRFSVYYIDQCTKLDIPQCEQTVSEATAEARSFIDEFNVQDTCLATNLCEKNTDDYERDFVEEIGKGMCSMLGPLETLCQQAVQGNIENMNSFSLNVTNIDGFFSYCEESPEEENAGTATTDQCSEENDRCQCCIRRVIQKKKCFKKRVARYVEHMLERCKRCPVQEKCEKYWIERKAYWDAKIDRICPKKACIRMGYCKPKETSSMCAFMGSFSQVCKDALNAVAELFGEVQSAINKP